MKKTKEFKAYQEATGKALQAITDKLAECIGAIDAKVNGMGLYVTEALKEVLTEEQMVTIEKRIAAQQHEELKAKVEDANS